MLIDCSFFAKRPRHILNASSGTIPNANAVEVQGVIEGYIAAHQEQFLIDMLGSPLGHRVNCYLVCLDEDFAPKHNKAFDVVCDQLRESFADYVFFYILRDNNVQSTVTGTVRIKCANEYVAPIRRQVSVWNDMVERNRKFALWAQSDGCPVRDIHVSENLTTKINTLNL